MDRETDNFGRSIFTMGGDEYLMVLPTLELLNPYMQKTLDSLKIPGSQWDLACGKYPLDEEGQKALFFLKKQDALVETGLLNWILSEFPILAHKENRLCVVPSSACRCNQAPDFSETIFRNYNDSIAAEPLFHQESVHPMLVPLDKNRAWDCERMAKEMPDGTITKGGILYVDDQPCDPHPCFGNEPFLTAETQFFLEDTNSDQDALEWISIGGMLLAKNTLFHCYRLGLTKIMGKQ